MQQRDLGVVGYQLLLYYKFTAEFALKQFLKSIHPGVQLHSQKISFGGGEARPVTPLAPLSIPYMVCWSSNVAMLCGIFSLVDIFKLDHQGVAPMQ